MRRFTFLLALTIFLTFFSCGTKEKVQFDVESVTLNYETNQIEITGDIKNLSLENVETVWIWVYFFGPEKLMGGSLSDAPIEIANPFSSGKEISITAKGTFHWAANNELPREGYFARVNISLTSKEDSIIPSSERDKNTSGAIVVKILK